MVVYLLKVYNTYEGEHEYNEVHDNKKTLEQSIELITMEGDLEYEIEELVMNRFEIG